MFFDVFTQVVILFILIGLGVILAKTKILNERGAKCMTDIALLIVTPSVIIKSFIRKFDRSLLKSLLISFLIVILVHVLYIIVSKILLHDKNKSREIVLQFGIIFANAGFMSLPLQQAILGDDGVFIGSSFVAIFNLVVWSYGLLIMTGDRKTMTPKKLLINPGIIGLAIGLVIFLFSIPVPDMIKEPISYMAGLNTPVPMIIIGYHLANSNLLDGLKDWKCLFAIALRIFILPCIVIVALYLCNIRGTMLVSTAISASAPTAAITTMFSAKYNRDTSLSVNLVSLSTVFSIISMPLVITFAQYLA